MNKLKELLNDRFFSRLYVEIYQKPTGFHSIEAMKADIESKNNQIENYRNAVPEFDKIIAEDQKSFEYTAIRFFVAKFPFLKNHLVEETLKRIKI